MNSGRFELKGLKNYKLWIEFEKIIPFRYTYGHLGYQYFPDEEILIISVNSKKCMAYRIIKKWFDNISKS